MTDTQPNRRLKQIGGLWNSKTRAGEASFSGEIILPDGTKLYVNVFRNAYKNEHNKQPDWRIFIPDDPPPDDGFPKDDPF